MLTLKNMQCMCTFYTLTKLRMKLWRILRHTQKYFTNTTASSIMWKETMQCLQAGEEACFYKIIGFILTTASSNFIIRYHSSGMSPRQRRFGLIILYLLVSSIKNKI